MVRNYIKLTVFQRKNKEFGVTSTPEELLRSLENLQEKYADMPILYDELAHARYELEARYEQQRSMVREEIRRQA